MDPTPAPGASVFPTNPEEFDSDDRISFSKLDNKFLLVQDDGTEFEFDDAIKRWIPVLDESKFLIFSTYKEALANSNQANSKSNKKHTRYLEWMKVNLWMQ